MHQAFLGEGTALLAPYVQLCVYKCSMLKITCEPKIRETLIGVDVLRTGPPWFNTIPTASETLNIHDSHNCVRFLRCYSGMFCKHTTISLPTSFRDWVKIIRIYVKNVWDPSGTSLESACLLAECRLINRRSVYLTVRISKCAH